MHRPWLLTRLRAAVARPREAEPDEVTPDMASYTADAPEDSPYRDVGVLLCHGFTGSPRSLRPWAEHLVAEGFNVSLPRLAGHGTSWQELNLISWQDWYATVDHALTDLRRRCGTTFVFGLSMGGGLSLRLAEQRPQDVAGLVLVNPSIGTADPRYRYLLPWLRWLAPSLSPIRDDIAKPGGNEGAYPRSPLHAAYQLTRLWVDVRANLDRVTCPLLLYRSDVDHVVDPTSSRLILAQARSSLKFQRRLKRSWHVATLDWDAEEIFAGSVEFIRKVLASRDQSVTRTDVAVA